MTRAVETDLLTVTRACWARALPASPWEHLIRQAAAACTSAEVEARTATALVTLLEESATTPSPLLITYIEHCIENSNHLSSTPLIRPGYLAASLSRSSTSSIALDRAFERINNVLTSPTRQKELTLVVENAQQLVEAFTWAGTRTMEQPSTRTATLDYVTNLLQRPPLRVTSSMIDLSSEVAQTCLAQLDLAVASVVSDAPFFTTLQNRLLETRKVLTAGANMSKVIPKVRRMTAGTLARPSVSLDEGLVEKADQDIAFLVSDLLHRASSAVGVSNTPFARARITAALNDRIAQAGQRGSTPDQALSRAFLEVILASTSDLRREGTDQMTRQASFAYSRMPELLRKATSFGGLDTPDGPLSALEKALRLFAEMVQADEQNSMQLDDPMNVSTTASRKVLDLLVISLCQQELVSVDVGASLSPSLSRHQLVRQKIPPMIDQLSSGSIDSIKEVFAALESFGPACHRVVSESLVEVISTLAMSADISALSSICSALLDEPSVLSIVFLHVPTASILSPIRSLLDSFGSSLENLGDDDPSTGYGSILLFLQIAVSRHRLHENLDLHLGSREGFIVRWLPSISATYSIASLDDDSKAVVNGWINALFGDGISDELMHATNPRVLLRALPTVAKQSFEACQAGVIDLEQLRDGLSFLLQGLLSFTLPGVLSWLIKGIESTPSGAYQKMMLDILSVLVLSESLPKTILELVAHDLDSLLAKLPSGVTSSVLDRKRVERLIKPYRRRSPLVNVPTPLVPTPSSSVLDLVLDPYIYSSSASTLLHSLLSTQSSSSLTEEFQLSRTAASILLFPPSDDHPLSRLTSFIIQDLPSFVLRDGTGARLGRWLSAAVSSAKNLQEQIEESRRGAFESCLTGLVHDIRRRQKLGMGGDKEILRYIQALVEGCEELGAKLVNL